MAYHLKQLACRCRVCGRKRDLGGRQVNVKAVADAILSFHGIDTRQDEPLRHPTKLCSGCSKFIERSCTAKRDQRRQPTTFLGVQQNWPRCEGDSCELCSKWHSEVKRGRPVRQKGRGGRPKKADHQEQSSEASTSCKRQRLTESVLVSIPDAEDHTLATRLVPFSFQMALHPERFVTEFSDDDHLLCPACKNVLDVPMAVPLPAGCEHSVCKQCWRQWLPQSATCPVCRSGVSPAALQPVPRVLWQALCRLECHCDFWANGCDAVVRLNNLRNHAESCPWKNRLLGKSHVMGGAVKSIGEGQSPTTATTPAITPRCTHITSEGPASGQVRGESSLNVTALLSAPLTQPISPVENRLLGGLLRRLSHQHRSRIGLPIFTGGRPTHISYTPLAAQSSSEVSERTLQRRRQHRTTAAELECGGPKGVQAQRAYEVAHFSQAEREQLLVDAKVHFYVKPDESLALATNLRLTHEQVRKLRRWTKQWNVHLASEGQTRKHVAEQLGDVEILTEIVQVIDAEEDGSRRLRPAALAFVKNPLTLIDQHLDSLRHRKLLTWHKVEPDGPGLPEDEIWVKIGGDKGGGSFKAALQIVNQPKPNSADHTTVISCLEADDTLANMHVSLDYFQDIISEMQHTQWRGCKIRIFCFGDIEFLTKLYGLSGSSGHHFCLKCHCTAAEAKVAPQDRALQPASRTLKSLAKDLDNFTEAGADLSTAKDHHNVIGPAFFNIPLDQVCEAGLHISLGIGLRLFNMLEEDCEEIDLLIALELEEMSRSPAVQEVVTTFRNAEQLEAEATELSALAEQHQTVHDWYCAAAEPAKDADTVPVDVQLAQLRTLVKQTIKTAATKRAQAKKLRGELHAKLKRAMTPSCDLLEKNLQKLNIQRQAYHGGGFVGNHIHKMLKECSVSLLAGTALSVCRERAPHLIPQATEIQTKHTRLFTSFGRCHRAYNSMKVFTESEIDQLETNITQFLQNYRELYPEANIFPKLHYLEDHVVKFVRKWKVGPGMMGEHGGESIHHQFNMLNKRFSGIPRSASRCYHMLKEHLLVVHPNLPSAPEPAKKKPRKD